MRERETIETETETEIEKEKRKRYILGKAIFLIMLRKKVRIFINLSLPLVPLIDLSSCRVVYIDK
mgnify:CR=1 FL=1